MKTAWFMFAPYIMLGVTFALLGYGIVATGLFIMALISFYYSWIYK